MNKNTFVYAHIKANEINAEILKTCLEYEKTKRIAEASAFLTMVICSAIDIYATSHGTETKYYEIIEKAFLDKFNYKLTIACEELPCIP